HTRSKRDWSSDVCSSDLPGDDGAQVRSGGEVINALEVDLLTHVYAQLLLGAVHMLQRAAQGTHIGLGLVLDEGEQHRFFVREVRSEERRVGQETGSHRWA